MGRFWRGMSAPRQKRGFQNMKLKTREERLKGMQMELIEKIRIYGEDHWLTREQKRSIARVEAEV